MVVLDYETNLSLTEFLLFQTCPQKFRLYRLLNPLPDPITFMTKKRAISSYCIKDSDENALRGLGYHHFFETFHKRYYVIITAEHPPPEIAKDRVKLLYWLHQQKRYYEVAEEYWFPHAAEVSLMTKEVRGVIDCLLLCPNKDGLYLLDYKARPAPDDHLTLLFYTYLFKAFQQENAENAFSYDYDVVEGGCYYYELGFEKLFAISSKDIVALTEQLKEVQTQIIQEKFPCQLSACWNCEYRDICKIEQKRRKN